MSSVAKNMMMGAEFSACGQFRYWLWRAWEWKGFANQVMFVGLNPSTADATIDDPTIRRCIRFAKDWGYSGMMMLNAYAYRATDPKQLKRANFPVGSDNDEELSYRAKQAGLVVACWGVNCPPQRALDVAHTIGKPLHCVDVSKHGAPMHPLYLPAELKPKPWSPPA